jgi:hypothetical protein
VTGFSGRGFASTVTSLILNIYGEVHSRSSHDINIGDQAHFSRISILKMPVFIRLSELAPRYPRIIPEYMTCPWMVQDVLKIQHDCLVVLFTDIGSKRSSEFDPTDAQAFRTACTTVSLSLRRRHDSKSHNNCIKTATSLGQAGVIYGKPMQEP